MLAIDPGLRAGFAIIPDMVARPKDVERWEKSFLVDPHYEYVIDYHRLVFAGLFDYLSEMLRDRMVSSIIIEQPFFRQAAVSAGVLLNGYRAVILTAATQPGSKVRWIDEIPPAEWQSWAKKEGWVKEPGKGGNGNDAAWMGTYAARILAA